MVSYRMNGKGKHIYTLPNGKKITCEHRKWEFLASKWDDSELPAARSELQKRHTISGNYRQCTRKFAVEQLKKFGFMGMIPA